ncbi:MAG: protease inhibitor I42 family protein [Roseateles sp.]|uniref:protease inhibitor I42 family protein n=1 Tax=Roseateles sp. TaxID=1971397 RepID=UPI0039EC577F
MAEHLLTQAQHGGALRATVGDDVLLRLPENPTTGYRWELAVPPGLSLLADEQVPAGSAPGGGGERVLRLRAIAPGCHAVNAALRRAWAPDDTPPSSFSATLEVT